MRRQSPVPGQLKPANVMLTPDGKVKILDFGLAKAFQDEPAADDASQSPTLTKGKALGVILETASYMSPEQARGKAVDRRTDNWALRPSSSSAQRSSSSRTGSRS